MSRRRSCRATWWLAAVVAVSVAATTAPRPVAERTLTANGRRTRVALFDNRVAAVSPRADDRLLDLRTMTLDEEVFVAYVSAIARDRDLVATSDDPTLGAGTAAAEIRVTDSNGVVHVVTYEIARVAALPLARLVAALDDLEAYVLREAPDDPRVETWSPRVGDVVVLKSGARARVREVRDDGVVTFEHLDVALIERVPPGQLARAVSRLEQLAP